jgi:hypothetical protein
VCSACSVLGDVVACSENALYNVKTCGTYIYHGVEYLHKVVVECEFGQQPILKYTGQPP